MKSHLILIMYFHRQNMILSDDDNLADLDNVMDVNVRGLIHCTKAAYRLMAKHEADGHIVNVSSILGHAVLQFMPEPRMNMYSPSKFAVTAALEVLRQELNYLNNSRVRVSVSDRIDVLSVDACLMRF